MHIGVKNTALLSLAAGLVITGVVAPATSAAPPEPPRPLVESVEGLEGGGAFVVSADGSKLFAVSNWDQSSIVDTTSREVIGTFSAVEDMESLGTGAPTQAAGPWYATPTFDGYALLSLDTGEVEHFEIGPRPGESYYPSFNTVVANASGQVSAVTTTGEYLQFDGATVTYAQRIFPDTNWPQPQGVSPDGSKYFFTLMDDEPPHAYTTRVIDMNSGAELASLASPATSDFLPIGFDAAEESLWGMYDGDYDRLAQVDLATGAVLSESSVPDIGGFLTLVDAAADWFVDASYTAVGGSLVNADLRGARQLQCCTALLHRLPNGGDLIYYDVEMLELGFVTAPTITDPTDQHITALGDTVVFTAESEGLALDPTEPGAVEDAPAGSIWQSSPDGTTWTDIPGATGSTLSVTADDQSYPLQYRRHFLDPFWGPAPSSQPARMIGAPPAITRPDNLPNGEAGETYPAETITATGQPGMTWASDDLPSTLTINPDTGEITGTTDTAGTFTFTVTVTDIFGTDSRDFTLTVTEDSVSPPEVTPPGETVTPPAGGDGSSPNLSTTGSTGWAGYATLAGVLVLAGAAGLIASRRTATRR